MEKKDQSNSLQISKEILDKVIIRGSKVGGDKSEEDAIIKIVFIDEYEREDILCFSDKKEDKFNDERHLGNYMRKIIRDKSDAYNRKFTGICVLNPWNKKIIANDSYVEILEE